MRKENWDDLRIVLAVSRGASFAQAARLLGINESTVVRRLTHAEQRLSARLFERSHGGIKPTEAGHRMIGLAERVELEVQDATNAVLGTDTRIAGTVRVTSVPLLVNRVLIPALSRLIRQHPDLRVELIAEPRVLSLTKREADVALRLARPRDEVRAFARKVGELSYAVYGPPGVEPKTLPWITYEDRMSELPQAEWIGRMVLREPSLLPHVLVNDAEGLVACVQAGLGKTLLPVAIGERTPCVARIGDHQNGLTRELWLLVHPDLRKLDRVRAVIKWATSVCNDLSRTPDSRAHPGMPCDTAKGPPRRPA